MHVVLVYLTALQRSCAIRIFTDTTTEHLRSTLVSILTEKGHSSADFKLFWFDIYSNVWQEVGQDSVILGNDLYGCSLRFSFTTSALVSSLPTVIHDPFAITRGAPTLAPRQFSESHASISFVHAPVTILRPFTEASRFTTFPQAALKFSELKISSHIWDMAIMGTLGWTTENDLTRFVVAFLLDICYTFGLPLSIVTVLEFHGLRPDIYIILRNGYPIGVVELKIPSGYANRETSGNPRLAHFLDEPFKPFESSSATASYVDNTMENENVAGQIFDYMELIRSFYGHKGPLIGILSTYESYRAFWSTGTKDNEVITRTNLDSRELKEKLTALGLRANSKLETALIPEDVRNSLYNIAEPEGEEAADQNFAVKSPMARTLYASEIVRYDDPNLIYFLGSALVKMILTNIERSIPMQLPTNLLTFTEYSVEWNEFNGEIQYSRFPNANTKKYLAIGDMHHGTTGRVWLAISTGGAVCVIKFGPSVDTDLQVWNKLFREKNVKPRLTKLVGTAALILPFVPHIEDADFKKARVQLSARAAFNELANLGTLHNDLKPENMGIYRKSDTVCLFDFSHVSSFDPKNQVQVSQARGAMNAWLDRWLSSKNIEIAKYK